MDYLVGKPLDTIPEFVTRGINLADPRLGAEIVAVSDQFFAPAERMLSPEPPRFYPDLYDDHGKWMDGWESRRRRGMGHDWCVVKLAVPGRLLGVDIETSFFTGNFPPAAEIEACFSETAPDENTQWEKILLPVSLKGDAHHTFELSADKVWTHLRLNILPDGGVARLRVYGRPEKPEFSADQNVNLAALEYGARVAAYSDSHYGDPNKVLLPNKGENMGDGWETRRRREPGNDWCIIELAQPGTISNVDIDTAYFKGNFPDAVSLQGAFMEAATDESIITQSMFWPELLPKQKLQADSMHQYESELIDLGAITHVKVNVYPDGGISRIRLNGKPLIK